MGSSELSFHPWGQALRVLTAPPAKSVGPEAGLLPGGAQALAGRALGVSGGPTVSTMGEMSWPQGSPSDAQRQGHSGDPLGQVSPHTSELRRHSEKRRTVACGLVVICYPALAL